MGYNITAWKTKKIEDFTVPLQPFLDYQYTDVEIVEYLESGVHVRIICKLTNYDIEGIVTHDKILHAVSFEIRGDGSGSDWDFCILPALKKSTGILEAILVWEGGDTIINLSVNGGDVKEEAIG